MKTKTDDSLPSLPPMNGHYTLKDCNCHYCPHFAGQNGRDIYCRVPTCACKAEIDEARARAGPNARFMSNRRILHMNPAEPNTYICKRVGRHPSQKQTPAQTSSSSTTKWRYYTKGELKAHKKGGLPAGNGRASHRKSRAKTGTRTTPR